MKILFFLLAAILASFTHYTIGCALPPTPFKPAYIQAHNPELDKWRSQLGCPQKDRCPSLSRFDEDTEVIEILREDLSDQYKCFQYMIETITGHNGYIAFPEKDYLTIDLSKYFQQTPYIKENSVLMYTENVDNRNVTHFAIGISSIQFKSKAGSHSPIFKHAPFNIFASYGKAIWSFELKPEYQGPENQKHLLEDMKIDLGKAYAQQITTFDNQITTLYNQRNWSFVRGFGLGGAYVLFLMVMGEKYLIPYLKSR